MFKFGQLTTTAALIVFTVYTLGGCMPSRHDNSAQTPGAAPTTALTSKNEGASSGGGGYVSENSQILIDRIRLELADQIRSSSPQIYSKIPKGLTQVQLAEVIEHIRLEPLKNQSRDGKQLMFNYGVDKNGPFIEALQPFFTVYGSEPVKFTTYFEFRHKYKDIRLKILHETGHLLGLNEDRSEKFGMEILTALFLNRAHCRSAELVSFPLNHEFLNEKSVATTPPQAPKVLEFAIFRGNARIFQFVDGMMAKNANTSYEKNQWTPFTAEQAVNYKPADAPSASELWDLQEEFTKWTVEKFDGTSVLYTTQNPPLWTGADSLLLVRSENGSLHAKYRYHAKELRKHSDVTNTFVALPTSGEIDLTCKESYQTLTFEP